MENIFKDTRGTELFEIYKDFLGSKEIGVAIESFKPYAKTIKNIYFPSVDYSLGMAISLTEKMFLEEIAKRYFEDLLKDDE